MSRKSSKKHARRRARENALAILYSSDIIESNAVSIVEEGRYPASDIHLSEYAEALVQGVSEHLAEIDEKLMATSENWALDRMPVVDRAILRLAVYEMLYVDEVPVSVAINEAVELAKAYGGEDESSRFVNGVLGRISRLEEAPAADEAREAAVEDGNESEEAVIPAEGAEVASDNDGRENADEDAARKEEAAEGSADAEDAEDAAPLEPELAEQDEADHD